MADSDSKIGVLIPVYNAAETIEEIIRQAKTFCSTIIVVDDGSNDESAHRIRAIRDVIFVQHPENRGKGAALRTGFQTALEQGLDAVITLDADGQHEAGEIPKFIQRHHQTLNHLLIGRRVWKKMPRATRCVRLLGALFLSARAGTWISDTQCGFRLYPRPWMERIQTTYPRYEMESEIILIGSRLHLPISSVDIETIYTPKTSALSHFRGWTDTWRIIFMYFGSFRSNWYEVRTKLS